MSFVKIRRASMSSSTPRNGSVPDTERNWARESLCCDGVGPGRAARHLGAGGGAEGLNCAGHSSMFTQLTVVVISSENDKP